MTTSRTPTRSAVVLRELRDGDTPQIVDGCSDEETSYWLGTLPSPFGEQDAAYFLDVQADLRAAGEAIHWAVADPVSDLLLGSVALLGLTSGAGPEVGYWTRPGARGRGVALAALRAVTAQAFAEPGEDGLGLRSLRLESATGNAASRRVAERAGFVPVGSRPHAICCRDGMHDATLYLLEHPGSPGTS